MSLDLTAIVALVAPVLKSNLLVGITAFVVGLSIAKKLFKVATFAAIVWVILFAFQLLP